MHISPFTQRTLASIPSEIVDEILRRLRTRDIASVARTCRRLRDFAHDPQFIERYVDHSLPRNHALLPPPQGVFRKRWLEQYVGWDGDCCRGLNQPIPWQIDSPAGSPRADLRAVKAAERLDGELSALPALTFGVFHPTGYKTSPKCIKATRSDPEYRPTAEYMLESAWGFSQTLARFAFPAPSPHDDAHHFERFYTLDNSLVALCTSGNQTWIYRIAPANQGERSAYRLESTTGWAFNWVTRILTAQPLRRINLTRWGMAPVVWNQKTQAILVWGERAPRLVRSCD